MQNVLIRLFLFIYAIMKLFISLYKDCYFSSKLGFYLAYFVTTKLHETYLQSDSTWHFTIFHL